MRNLMAEGRFLSRHSQSKCRCRSDKQCGGARPDRAGGDRGTRRIRVSHTRSGTSFPRRRYRRRGILLSSRSVPPWSRLPPRLPPRRASRPSNHFPGAVKYTAVTGLFVSGSPRSCGHSLKLRKNGIDGQRIYAVVVGDRDLGAREVVPDGGQRDCQTKGAQRPSARASPLPATSSHSAFTTCSRPYSIICTEIIAFRE